MLVVAILISSIIVEVLWVLTVRRVATGNAFWSAFLGTLIVLANGFLFINYVRNPLLILVAGLGTFTGSYFTVKVDKNVSKKN